MKLKKRGNLILGIIQLFVALGAIPAGYSLIAEPDGSGLGMSLNLLSGSPFNDFFIPGLCLFIVNGIFNLAGSILAFCNFRFTPYHRIRIGNSPAYMDISAGLFRWT